MEKRIAAFGEIMLRLCPAGKKRFQQVLPGQLEATFGGGEANVCVSLAMLGADTRYLTALPDNPISQTLLTQLRGLGVETDMVLLSPNGRLGIYYAEHGAALRGSNVVYDRENSVISQYGPDDYCFEAMLVGCSHLHLTGITPALSEKAYRATLGIAEAAASLGLTISCDLNYRKKLWKWRPGISQQQLASKCMSQIVTHADIIIGNEEDAGDVFNIHAEGAAVEKGCLNTASYQEVAVKLAKQFPKAAYIAITLRESISADHNNWGGMLYDARQREAFFAPLSADGEYQPYQIHDIVDRFGGGDSFCAGLLYALNTPELAEPATAIRFAAAASALKHTIEGDFNFSSISEIMALLKGNSSGRVMR